MDLAYLRAHPDVLPLMLEHQRIRVTPLRHGPGGRAERWTLDDGTSLFAKTLEGAPNGFFDAERDGLEWLRVAGGVAVPEVLYTGSDVLVLAWLDAAPPGVAAAEEFGRRLSVVHRAGAPSFGAERPGFIATLPLDNASEPDWATFYVERRCRPFVRAAFDRGVFTSSQVDVLERALLRVSDLAGPAEPVARLHGDLWSGNVLWTSSGAFLIDPAAHGGHRETDLAMLALFGLPHLDRVLAAYDEAWPLAEGWRSRVPLHQLHPLLVHAVLFGGSYAASTLELCSAF